MTATQQRRRPAQRSSRAEAALGLGVVVGAAGLAIAGRYIARRAQKSAHLGLVDWPRVEQLATNRLRNVPGALYRILEPIVSNGINLTKIESRPAKSRAWEYVIFVDVEGHRETPNVAAALREIAERTIYLKILGSYPAG